jgi:hypothetical protein
MSNSTQDRTADTPSPLECLKLFEEEFGPAYDLRGACNPIAAVKFIGSFMPVVRAVIAKAEADWLAEIDKEILQAQFKRGLQNGRHNTDLVRRSG